MNKLLLALLLVMSNALAVAPATQEIDCFPLEAGGRGSELTITRDDEVTVVTWWCNEMGRMVMVPSSQVSLFVLLNLKGPTLSQELTRLQGITDYRWMRRGLYQLMNIAR